MLKTIFALANVHLKEFFIYKSNFYLFTLNRIVEVVVYIFVWQAIYSQTGNAGGFTIEQMVTYYILVTSLRPFAIWGINDEMSHSIKNGKIDKELLSPITYFQYYFGRHLGELAFGVLVALVSFICCAIFWKVTLPINIASFVLMIIVIAISIPIGFFIQMIVGTAGFYTNSIWGMTIFRRAIISIFSGIIAPLTLFPEWFQKISNILPFKEFIYTPVNIYLGQIGYNEIILVIIKQLIWIVVLYIIAKMFFNHAVKKITINGG